MDDKITIIEGPPPTFEAVSDGWVLGLNESLTLAEVALTRLRTFNGPALVERCYRAWRERQTIYLEYRSEDGTERAAPIVAARFLEADEGHILLLWVRITEDEVEVEIGYDDDDTGDEYDDDPGYADL